MAIIEDGPTTKGVDDGAQDTTDQEINQGELEPSGEAAFERGGADHEAGKDAGTVEGEDRGPAEGAEPQSGINIAPLEEKIAALTQQLEAMKLKANEPPPPPPMTEERWAQLEQEWGAPRSTIDRVTRQSVQVYEKMKSYVDEKLSALEKDSAISGFSKDPRFADAGRFRKDMDDFLRAFDSKHHSNKELIERAYWYAKGKASGGDMKSLRSTDEKNRQIAGRLKPGRSEGGSMAKGGASSRALTETQRQAAELLEGGEAEYQKLRQNRNRPIVI